MFIMSEHGGHTVPELMRRHRDALAYIARSHEEPTGVFAEGLGGFVAFYLALAGSPMQSIALQNAPAILTEERWHRAIAGGVGGGRRERFVSRTGRRGDPRRAQCSRGARRARAGARQACVSPQRLPLNLAGHASPALRSPLLGVPRSACGGLLVGCRLWASRPAATLKMAVIHRRTSFGSPQQGRAAEAKGIMSSGRCPGHSPGAVAGGRRARRGGPDDDSEQASQATRSAADAANR